MPHLKETSLGPHAAKLKLIDKNASACRITRSGRTLIVQVRGDDLTGELPKCRFYDLTAFGTPSWRKRPIHEMPGDLASGTFELRCHEIDEARGDYFFIVAGEGLRRMRGWGAPREKWSIPSIGELSWLEPTPNPKLFLGGVRGDDASLLIDLANEKVMWRGEVPRGFSTRWSSDNGALRLLGSTGDHPGVGTYEPTFKGLLKRGETPPKADPNRPYKVFELDFSTGERREVPADRFVHRESPDGKACVDLVGPELRVTRGSSVVRIGLTDEERYALQIGALEWAGSDYFLLRHVPISFIDSRTGEKNRVVRSGDFYSLVVAESFDRIAVFRNDALYLGSIENDNR